MDVLSAIRTGTEYGTEVVEAVSDGRLALQAENDGATLAELQPVSIFAKLI